MEAPQVFSTSIGYTEDGSHPTYALNATGVEETVLKIMPTRRVTSDDVLSLFAKAVDSNVASIALRIYVYDTPTATPRRLIALPGGSPPNPADALLAPGQFNTSLEVRSVAPKRPFYSIIVTAQGTAGDRVVAEAVL